MSTSTVVRSVAAVRRNVTQSLLGCGRGLQAHAGGFVGGEAIALLTLVHCL